ncbi:MAG: hypothetical protein KatS3mg077_1871 [Candidatus Binatia bacterium]|nr:MAG: hypothetical protein KatS3mg077_1871 [Candidatus Binatia bacterium]
MLAALSVLPSAASGVEPVPSWEALLGALAQAPRENGSPELLAAAAWLADTLRSAGWEVSQHWYTAYPFEQRLLGVLLLFGGCTYAVCMWRRHFGWALATAFFLPWVAIAQIDFRVPFSWVAAVEQPNVVARLPNPPARLNLIFSAHLDTKTDLLDHIARAPILVFAAPAALLMCVVAAGSLVAFRAGNFATGRQALARVLGWVGALYGLALGAVFSGGIFVRHRSPGALDDGAACAVLVRLAYELRAQPPRGSEVYLVFFSGEELAAQGADALLRSWRPAGESRTTRVINLDPLGASSEFRVLSGERGILRSVVPSPEVIALIGAAHQELRGHPVEVQELIGLTDTWMWRQHGFAAATLFSSVPPFALPRGLHSYRDNVSRVDIPALDFSLALLHNVVRVADRQVAGTDAPSPKGIGRNAMDGESGLESLARRRLAHAGVSQKQWESKGEPCKPIGRTRI